MNKQENGGCSQKTLIQLTHHRQRYNWDCGISCVLMVLPKSSMHMLDKNLTTICKEEGFNKSTWTIDLCYLLHRYKVKHQFYTVTLGIHPGYRNNSFYNGIIPKDEDRIKSRFKEAKNYGIDIREDSLNNALLLEHLKYGPAILLTNARLLNCDLCKINKLSTELRKCLPWPTINYQGHYIVLCGYNLNRRKVYYRNPSLTDHICIMSIESLEDARKSYGTDQDTILIFW